MSEFAPSAPADLTELLRKYERELTARDAEVQQLQRELRHQIERRSELLVESLLSQRDHRPVPARAHLAEGTVVAQRYRIGEILGQGAMAVVYAVERLTDGRRFAAKVLGGTPDSQAMARFAREAQLMARLQHRSLPAIVDADVTKDGVAYIVMEQARGKRLTEFPSRYRDCEFLLPILYQVAAALTAVHAAGVVHRDVKPDNVLIAVGADGENTQATLVDFGVSRLLSSAPAKLATPVGEQPIEVSAGRAAVTLPLAEVPVGSAAPRRADELTQAGALLGTLLYMAPELSSGANQAYPPADIFSFGVMSYEVLTGALPFAELALRIPRGASPGFAPLRSLCPKISAALAHTLESCLSLEPARRPSAGELATALNQAQQTSYRRAAG